MAWITILLKVKSTWGVGIVYQLNVSLLWCAGTVSAPGDKKSASPVSFLLMFGVTGTWDRAHMIMIVPRVHMCSPQLMWEIPGLGSQTHLVTGSMSGESPVLALEES